MKKMLATLLCFCCSGALAQTAEELVADGKNTENVTTFGMGYDLKMYSPLRQINKSNVKRLVPVWSTSLMNDMGELAQPTIYNGVMYVVNGNWTFAIDVATGQQIWRTPVEYDRAALRVVGAAGVIMRGARDDLQRQALPRDDRQPRPRARHEDRQGDLEAEVRRVEGRLHRRHRADGRQRRADLGHGRRRAHHARLPRRLGSGDRQEAVAPLHHSRAGRARLRDLAARTPDAWKYGGGATWQTGSYDPQLDLVYWGTGNAEPYNPTYRGGARQPLHRQRARDPAEDRRDRLALPVHAERRATTSTAPTRTCSPTCASTARCAR